MATTPVIPTDITVHLGAPKDENARNITVPFVDYIKNVASSEIYPTWDENAIRANIYAQISFALNRIYTEWYPARGYDFDITNSTAFDQYYVEGRDVFGNISQIVDEVFNDYVVRDGSVEPLFTQYCNGTTVTCEGLSQWGTVPLAESGLTPLEILQNYYGDDISIVENAPIQDVEASYPEKPLKLGDSGNDVKDIQVRLNRISTDYPAIPKIYPVDGVYSVATEDAVKKFQEVFDLTSDGIVGKATWYKIIAIFSGVKNLAELDSEGLMFDEISQKYPGVLKEGDRGTDVASVQYYLAVISQYYPNINLIEIDGIFGPNTKNAVIQMQKQGGIPQTGVVDRDTWNVIYNTYMGIVSNPQNKFYSGIPVFPGRVLSRGISGDDVELMQEYLNFIAETYTEIPRFEPTGFYGEKTEQAVLAFQNLFGINPATGTIGAVTWYAISRVYEDLKMGAITAENQYSGYILKEE